MISKSYNSTIRPISHVIKNELCELLKRQLAATTIKTHIENGVKHGSNFIGIVYRVVGTRTSQENDAEAKVQNIFLKIAPDNPIRRERFNVRANFLREMLVYNEACEHRC